MPFTTILALSALTFSSANGLGPAQSPGVQNPRALEGLSKSNAVLVLVDYTDGLMPIVKTLSQKALKNNTIALAKIGKAFKLPTIVLGDEGGFRGKQMPELMEIVKNDTFIPRHTPSAWREPAFVSAVQKTGRKKLIMAGISTDNCVALLALDAMRAGYDTYIVVDAGGSDSKHAEDAALSRLTAAGAVLVNWVQLASELLVDWETPEGPVVGKIYQDHLDSKPVEESAQRAFDAWRTGEETGDYRQFKALLSPNFREYSHPVQPSRGHLTGPKAKERMLQLVAERESRPNQLKFSQVKTFTDAKSVMFQFRSSGKLAGGFPYSGDNTLIFGIEDGMVVSFREYFGDVDPSWFGGGKK
ncbi:MAG: isochorismatase family protein [Fimbriimonadaceae bacterium]|nr:isochorismatase family protein [Fimbriimonadaceae bacterium]